MAELLYKYYQNLLIFAKQYRKFKVEKEYSDINDFIKSMRSNEYADIVFTDNSGKGIIMLFPESSKYTHTQYVRKLLESLKGNKIYMVYKEMVNSHVLKVIKNYNVKIYLHNNFKMEIPKGPNCYYHRIMKEAEVNELINDYLHCKTTNLPKIYDNDPQCIWIGAEEGDVLEIITPFSINYRLVIPSGIKNLVTEEIVTEVKKVDEAEEPEELEMKDEIEPEISSESSESSESENEEIKVKKVKGEGEEKKRNERKKRNESKKG